MHYTENEDNFWKYHSMGCGFRGEFKRKLGYPGDPIIYVCPKCGSEYRPEQEHEGEIWTFAGDSVDMFSRASDEDLIEELHCRGYEVKEKASGVLERKSLKTVFKVCPAQICISTVCLSERVETLVNYVYPLFN